KGVPVRRRSGVPFARRLTDGYFRDWISKIESALKGAQFYLQSSELKDAAFTLHQATERSYACFLLTQTLYFPRSHNIKFLRSLGEDKELRLVEAWPRATKQERRRFELLKRAYVEARYSPNYTIELSDLEALAHSVGTLRTIVEAVCLERLEMLRMEAGI
ncbi:MAG: HEPN domain-containing protein, partial [Sphingomonas bacterium]